MLYITRNPSTPKLRRRRIRIYLLRKRFFNLKTTKILAVRWTSTEYIFFYKQMSNLTITSTRTNDFMYETISWEILFHVLRRQKKFLFIFTLFFYLWFLSYLPLAFSIFVICSLCWHQQHQYFLASSFSLLVYYIFNNHKNIFAASLKVELVYLFILQIICNYFPVISVDLVQ